MISSQTEAALVLTSWSEISDVPVKPGFEGGAVDRTLLSKAEGDFEATDAAEYDRAGTFAYFEVATFRNSMTR